MVVLLENWDAFREYVERWPLAELIYQISEHDKGKNRVRIVAGRYAVDIILTQDDTLLREILDFLKDRAAKRALEVVQDVETFFSR